MDYSKASRASNTSTPCIGLIFRSIVTNTSALIYVLNCYRKLLIMDSCIKCPINNNITICTKSYKLYNYTFNNRLWYTSLSFSHIRDLVLHSETYLLYYDIWSLYYAYIVSVCYRPCSLIKGSIFLAVYALIPPMVWCACADRVFSYCECRLVLILVYYFLCVHILVLIY